MSPLRWPSVLAGLVVGIFAGAAHAASIDHKAVGCVPAERFPRFEAHLSPAESVGRARVVFRAEGGPVWYSVVMKREGDVFAAALPKPKSSLKKFHYYLEVADTSLATRRTEEYSADVVSGRGACKRGMMSAAMSVASVLLEAPVGAPAVPVGFSSAGVVAAAGSTAAAAGGATAAAGGGAGIGTAAILVGGGAVVAVGVVAATQLKGDGDGSGPDGGGSAQIAEISGQVFAGVQVNQNVPDTNINPVGGAVVSTSLDSNTAVTDGSGRFALRTNTRVESGFCYTITIRASGLPTYSVAGSFGSYMRDRIFVLDPPAPFVPGPCATR